ncbi:phytoene synthase [Mucilaginibacter sp. PPCGB 2223]|uniref:phytoene/squalene synthase family protein n=1 Tax=Mucilaginibacter sp. PPCGB 2223 TaxID=1886027 RepID=UPI00082427A6|nr:phytoene/squalene synthase family protein [Mucilaginibacter sp. PPCGB 2223]OCX51095.1 phytoene synthase [Mucilaginibacter sp. PPCGB 2223]
MPNQIDLFNKTCFECSKLITNNYSTSFSLGIKAFDKRFRDAIYAIYGFVRYADEIVDTFHDQDKATLIAGFREATFSAIQQRISLNPVLQAFQLTVHRYRLEPGLIEAFLLSMEMDLDKTIYNEEGYQQYIYGSAEVIGLMCLRIFCEDDKTLYSALIPKARSLGSAFQKINFLRDIKADFGERGRVYFPGVDLGRFGESDKKIIEADIQTDLDDALSGIRQLPDGAKLGVYIAYVYYLELFKKIRLTPASIVLQKRIRIPDGQKMALYIKALVQQKLNRI